LSYWIIVYIFLKKKLGTDISESVMGLAEKGGHKIKHLLADLDVDKFSFKQGFLECEDKKVSPISDRLDRSGTFCACGLSRDRGTPQTFLGEQPAQPDKCDQNQV